MSGDSSDPLKIAIGLFLTVFAGVLNGSWNASFNPTLNLAVGNSKRAAASRTASNTTTTTADIDLEYHHAFALFQIYAALLNLVVCFVWAGGYSNVSAVIQDSSTGDILLVAFFSFLWGLGSLGFGLACRIAGVGLGTNLTIGLVVVTGTFLPLCYEGVIQQPTGWVILPGLAICLIGLYFSMRSLQLRDVDDNDQQATAAAAAVTAASAGKESGAVTTAAATMHLEESNDRREHSSPVATSEAIDTDLRDALETTKGATEKSYSTVQKVAVCLVSGLLATQLQFAFVFGQDIIDIANANDSTPTGGAAAIIWLLAISIGCPPIVAYMLYYSPDPMSTLWWTLWRRPVRHVKLFLTTAVPWVAHIHLYGLVSNKLLPSQIGSSIAWPLLMMTTVTQGMILSILLGEWKNASVRTRKKVRLGLGIVFIGIVVIMSSAAV